MVLRVANARALIIDLRRLCYLQLVQWIHLENRTGGTSRDMLGYPGISLDLGITRDIPTYPYKNWDMFERKSYTWDILEKKSHVLGYVFDLKLYQGYPRTSLLKQDKIRDNPGSFFAAPGGLPGPAAAGLHTQARWAPAL